MSLTPDLLDRMDAYWRAANYLSVGQIYLLDNPLLRVPLRPAHIKPRLLGHWGTTPGQNFVYVHAAAGDVPTLEILAAVAILNEQLPSLRIRVVNVVDLMKLQPVTEHPHGLSDVDFDQLFTKDKPIIFAYHGYAWLIHRLTYRRTNHSNLHVRGDKEEGTITTPFDMAVLNDLDRFHLAADAIDRLPALGSRAAYCKQMLADLLIEHRQYIRRHGEDMPSIRRWRWPGVTVA